MTEKSSCVLLKTPIMMISVDRDGRYGPVHGRNERNEVVPQALNLIIGRVVSMRNASGLTEIEYEAAGAIMTVMVDPDLVLAVYDVKKSPSLIAQ